MRMTSRSLFPVTALSALIAFAGLPAAQAAEEKVSLVQKAIEVNREGPYAGAFDTLIAAVLAADPAVVSTLSDNSQQTVFAPTDDAFAALGLTSENIDAVIYADLRKRSFRRRSRRCCCTTSHRVAAMPRTS